MTQDFKDKSVVKLSFFRIRTLRKKISTCLVVQNNDKCEIQKNAGSYMLRLKDISQIEIFAEL